MWLVGHLRCSQQRIYPWTASAHPDCQIISTGWCVSRPASLFVAITSYVTNTEVALLWRLSPRYYAVARPPFRLPLLCWPPYFPGCHRSCIQQPVSRITCSTRHATVAPVFLPAPKAVHACRPSAGPPPQRRAVPRISRSPVKGGEVHPSILSKCCGGRC